MAATGDYKSFGPSKDAGAYVEEKFGETGDNEVGFYGVTPVARQTLDQIADTSAASTEDVGDKVNALIQDLYDLGLLQSS